MKPLKTAAQIQALLERHSSFWPRQLRSHPEDIPWLLRNPPTAAARNRRLLETEWRPARWDRLAWNETLDLLHKVKRREMLRITLRDLAGYAPLETTVAELSALADFCLGHALDCAHREMIARYGAPRAQHAILGLGKLGGMELNYSSDIDLVFVYSEEGFVGRMSHHDFFTRVAGKIVQGFRANGHQGALFRVDLRLRPEGNSGPITRSLESYENYYAAFGEVWERMALQKTRFVAGDEELGYEFTQHLQPFCFPRSLPPAALDEIYRIKLRIESEILREGGLERHVKLGRGGIREIEFAIQTLQLLHGSRNAFTQERGTLKSIQALQRLDLLTAPAAAALTDAYVFLRRLEHRLQMWEDRQTHLVPEDPAIQTALARGLGFKNHAAFEAEWRGHNRFVRDFFQSVVQPTAADQQASPPQDWDVASPERDRLLREAGFHDPEKAAATLRTLAEGPEYAHVAERTRGLFQQLTPHLLTVARGLARPDASLQQFERFIAAYGSRSSVYELLASNPKTFELLFKLFDRSPFLTEIIVHHPALLEAIAFEGLLAAALNRPALESALAQELGESVAIRLRSFQRAQLLRIALRDILGLAASIEETCREMSRLADVCLGAAVAAAIADSSARGGKSPPAFCVIALGKYGGSEISYGADLDVIFVGGTAAMAARVMAIMSQEPPPGIVFKMDARLRPDGVDGALSLPLAACRWYYAERAQLWERQALTRARVAAGNPRLGAAFLKFAHQLIYSRPVSPAEWREIRAMRARIENERGDPDDPARDFKTGAGGLVDVEFLVQACQLRYGRKEPALRVTSTVDLLRVLPRITGWKQADADTLLEDYLWLRKLEGVLRCVQNVTVSQLPSARTDWEAPARHLGLADAATLTTELMTRRSRIRTLTERLMRP